MGPESVISLEKQGQVKEKVLDAPGSLLSRRIEWLQLTQTARAGKPPMAAS